MADLAMVPAGRQPDRMVFGYMRDHHVDDEGEQHTTMRPRIPVRIRNVLPASRGGSDNVYSAYALVDSGADVTLITRKAADDVGLDPASLDRVDAKSASGSLGTYQTQVRIEIIYNGWIIDLGGIPAAFPKEDVVEIGGRPLVLAGRRNIFDQFSVKFDDYKQVLVMERTGPGAQAP